MYNLPRRKENGSDGTEYADMPWVFNESWGAHGHTASNAAIGELVATRLSDLHNPVAGEDDGMSLTRTRQQQPLRRHGGRLACTRRVIHMMLCAAESARRLP